MIYMSVTLLIHYFQDRCSDPSIRKHISDQKKYNRWGHICPLGFLRLPRTARPLFLVFLAIYNFSSIAGHLGMMVIIKVNPKLRTPMYFFLSHLSFVDFCCSSIIAPKTLVNLLAEDRTTSFGGCMVQFFLVCTFVGTELILFAVMAYDRFVAICSPLLYTVVMSQRLCATLVVVSYAWGVACSLTRTCSAVQVSFRGFDTITSSVSFLPWCPSLILLLLSAALRFPVATFNELLTLPVTLTSCVFTVATSLKTQPAGGRRKAFSARASRLTAIGIFPGAIPFLSSVPSSTPSRHTVKVASVFYTAVIPTLNPLIYSLRNKDVKDTVRKLLKTKLFSH